MMLSVVMPVYNEAATIDEIVARVLASTPRGIDDLELIIVDDASTDDTPARLQSLASDPRVRVLRHERNRGKGAALRTGFAEIRGDIALVQDADLEYDPADYPRLLAPILSGRADVVFGSRFVGADSHRVLYFWHYLANRFLTLLSNACTNLNMTDMEACSKVFRADVLRRIIIEEDRFGVEPELVAKVARLRARVYEVGISYAGRTYEEGKKITWRDGFHALWCIFKYNALRRATHRTPPKTTECQPMTPNDTQGHQTPPNVNQ